MSKIMALDTHVRVGSGRMGIGIRNTKDEDPCLEENRTKITEGISYKCLKQ